MSRALSLSLITVAFLVGTGLGFVFAPEYARSNLHPTSGEPSARSADLTFLEARELGDRAVLSLAQTAATASQRPELTAFARSLEASEAADLAQLDRWRQSWHQDARALEGGPGVRLGAWDADFDLRFLNALEEQALDAIAAASQQRRVSVRQEVLTYASELIRSQTAELDQVRAWRRAWYGL